MLPENLKRNSKKLAYQSASLVPSFTPTPCDTVQHGNVLICYEDFSVFLGVLDGLSLRVFGQLVKVKLHYM